MTASQPITTRAEAVAWLRVHGCYAAERNWSFGESLIVGSHQSFTDTDPPIGLIQKAHCVFPQEDGWALQILGERGTVRTFDRLDSAVRAAAHAVSASTDCDLPHPRD
jgi:hypothetical protein